MSELITALWDWTIRLAYPFAQLVEPTARIGVVFWGLAALVGVATTPLYGVTSAMVVVEGILGVLYCAILAVATRRIRIAAQPATVRPDDDLREVVSR